MKLLLHICCAPCSAACIKVLRDEGIDVHGYWYNPNIHPYKEYEARLNALKEYSKMIDLKVVYYDYYGLREFTANVYDKLNNRCEYCYYSRMENVVRYAKENGYDAFTTTLFISPYQQHELLKRICEKLAEKYEIKFKYDDFRPYFYEGKRMFHETGLYMQKYCGCVFSEEERYLCHTKKKAKDSNWINLKEKSKMNIYIGHSNDFNFKEELYMPIINSKLNEENQFIFPHLSDKTFNSKEVIEQSDLFIAEVSRPSLGLGIEIGRAEMKNKRILCIYNEKFNAPSSLKYVNVDILAYKDTEDMICKIEEYIEVLRGKI